MRPPAQSPAEHKQAAVEQWTNDPCEQRSVEVEPGSPGYAEDLLAARRAYGPWMAEILDYSGTSGLRVLDVGCGQGIDLANYARAGAEATGIDLTPRHVQLATDNLAALGLTAEVVQGDAESLPFPAETFDRVSSNGVLHHTPDMPAALYEIRRVLRPGGAARIIVYNRRSFHYVLQQVLYLGLFKRQLFQERSMAGVLSRGVEHTSVGARPLVRVFGPAELRRLMREAGFREVTTEIRHFKPSDTFVTAIAERRMSSLRDPSVLDRIGRAGGWYVTGIGRR